MAIIQFVDVGESVNVVAPGVLTATEVMGSIGIWALPMITFSTTASSREAVLELAVPPGAVVTRALARLVAEQPGETALGSVATVRSAVGSPEGLSDQIVVDFGSLRTVSGVAVPFGNSVASVSSWVGTAFAQPLRGVGPGQILDFTEVQTERLLLTLSSPVTPADFAGVAAVTTTTPPADLELLVGGDRVWLRAGPAPAGFTEDVDVTAAVQAAVDAGGPVDADGNLAVRVVLQARVPGTLGLALAEPILFLRTLAVDFPGPTQVVRFAEEGDAVVDLPLPAGSASWVIHRVVAAVAADDPGPVRVLPPTGPAPSTHAEVLLDPDRRLVARLPGGPLARLQSLTGVRVLLRPEAGGIAIGAALLGGTADEPGEPLPDATLGSVDVPAGDAPAWVTLALPRPLVPPPDQTLWLSLSVTRGRAVLGLADAAAVPAGDLSSLRRIAPNGLSHPPSTAVLFRSDPATPAVPVSTDALALRVAGIAPDERPVAVADIDLVGGGTRREPGAAGTISISLDPVGTRAPIQLRVTTTSATAVTVGPVVVAYTEPGVTP